MTNKTKILLVEDEKTLSDMYKTKFEMENYEIIQSFDGKDGLEKAKKIDPDIILLDIILPKLDGFLVLKDLKSDDQLKKIPVLLLTNLGQEDDIKKGKKLGADGYFVKANHNPAEIVDKVREQLK
ncbi:MAG: response regulator [Patescibacteria group bacterium]|nr:response regulator [Patescibacteria group bacterium]